MLEMVIEQRRRDLGGFEVGRILPSPGRRMVGPFIFLDHMGPADFAAGLPRAADVRPHPHIGLSTVTYLFEGEIMHRDSVGSEQAIRPGAVNWMTAGRGITHSERFEKARAMGDRLHGLQSWVALPVEDEETAPSFHHYPAASLPTATEDGASMRLIAGEAFGVASPVKTHSPLFYIHWELATGASVELPPSYSKRAAYLVSGSVEADGRAFEAGQLLVFTPRTPTRLTALAPAVLVALGGEPLGERFIEWNFVSHAKARIAQAKADWRAGRMTLPAHDNTEFIPLPPDPPPAPSAM